MDYKFLSHCFRCLIWFAFLHLNTEASPCPGIEPDACKLHQSNFGVSDLNTAMQSLPTRMGDAAAAPDPPLRYQRGRGSSVAEMTGFPSENDETGIVEERAHVSKLPTCPCENQGEGGYAEGVLQSVTSSGVPLETKPSYSRSRNSNPSSEMVEDQVPLVQARGDELPLQQNVCLAELQQTMMEESASDSDPSLFLLLPTEMADQQMLVHECPATTSNGDAGAFETELRKKSKRPGSGTPSRQHNTIPLADDLRSSVEETMSASFCQLGTQADVSLGIELVNKDLSSGECRVPAAASGGQVQELPARNGDDSRSFEEISPNHLQSVLAKGSKKPGSGGSSKGHN